MIKNKELYHAPVFDATLFCVSNQHKLDSVRFLKKFKKSMKLRRGQWIKVELGLNMIRAHVFMYELNTNSTVSEYIAD